MAMVYRPERIPGLKVLSCTDPFEFRPHIHDRYVVWLNTAGGEHYSLGGSTDILAPGSISVIEPGAVHGNRPCSETARHLRSFYVEAGVFQSMGEQLGLSGAEGLGLARGPITDRSLWTDLARLHEMMLGDVPGLELSTRVTRVFGDLLRRHGRLGALPKAPEKRDVRIDRVLDCLRENLDTPLTLETLAGHAGCTPYHLIRLFRKTLGMTPHAYLTQLRLENARRMLEQGESIANSALASGFSDQSHLTRAFRSRYGLPPGAYQRSS
ncbi:helix-turn-helix domain-containing protein [Desulfoluna butyratoxydans]|uniref:Arac-type arabinose-binding/dimerisation domain n=1 Tax=Desulfoluna butyratoxydans TaxID=231438 RepID=A0A4V6YUD7_9BACT|nr:AraC family transcriptional regulator [Desulfoluna butyratoxydans]VFQ44828.1 arac-type arabinose-binding/dimerisation domain [Desulfoluna butyratoxydans]